MSASASTRLLHKLLRGFWEGTWLLVAFEPPACPDIPAGITMDVDDICATVNGPDWVEKGSLVAAHALLDRVWDRLGWPALRDFRTTQNDNFRAHGWEDFVYRTIGASLLALSEGWPPVRRAHLLAVLQTHRVESAEDALEALAKREPAAAVFLKEDAALIADVFEGQRKRSWIKLLDRSADLFVARKTLSRYSLLQSAAVYATGGDAHADTVIARATPTFVSFDPLDEIAIGSQTVREAAACYALGQGAAELALPHLDALLEQRRNRAVNSLRRAGAHMSVGKLDQAHADFAVFESAVLRLAEHTGDDGWRAALLYARADWLVGGPLGAATRRDGLAPWKKGAKAKPPAQTERDRWDAKRRELLEPALAAFAAIPQERVYRFKAYHLRLPLSGVEAALRKGEPG